MMYNGMVLPGLLVDRPVSGESNRILCRQEPLPDTP
jgi:hypothetical protein